jgi:hypothetical protein
MQNDTYELLNSLSDEDIIRIQNRDFAPLEKIKNKKTGNNQQPQQQMEPSQRPMNQNQGMLPEESQNPYKNNSIGRNLASGLASGAYENVRGIADLIGLKPKPRQFWGDPESNSFGFGKFLGEWGTPAVGALKAGKAIGKAAPALRQAASWLPEALGVGAVGAAVHPGSINERLATGAGEAALVPAFHGAVKGFRAAKQGISNARSNLKYSSPGKFNEETRKTVQEVLGNKPFTKEVERESITGIINKKARDYLTKSNEMYNGIIKEATEKGYDGVKKKIEFNNRDYFLNKADIDADKNISHLFANFLEKPSFGRAHRLQSALGRESFALKNPENREVVRKRGELYGELHDKIVDAMDSTIKKNGDNNILSSYKNASNYYERNVVPYYKSNYEISNISRSLPEKERYHYPRNIIHTLLEDTHTMKKVRDDMPKGTKRTILSRLLNGVEDNPKLLKKRINKINSGGEFELVNKKDLKQIEDFLRKGKGLEIVREFVKNNKKKLLLLPGAATIYVGAKAGKALVSKED